MARIALIWNGLIRSTRLSPYPCYQCNQWLIFVSCLFRRLIFHLLKSETQAENHAKRLPDDSRIHLGLA